MMWQKKLQEAIENQSTFLDLANSRIIVEEVRSLTKELRNSQIKSLNLSNNNIGTFV